MTTTVEDDILIWSLIDDNPNLSMDGNIGIGGLQALPKGRKLPTVGAHGYKSKTGSDLIVASKVVFNMLVYVTLAKTTEHHLIINYFYFLLH